MIQVLQKAVENTNTGKGEVGFHILGNSRSIHNPKLIILEGSVFMLGTMESALGEEPYL